MTLTWRISSTTLAAATASLKARDSGSTPMVITKSQIKAASPAFAYARGLTVFQLTCKLSSLATMLQAVSSQMGAKG